MAKKLPETQYRLGSLLAIERSLGLACKWLLVLLSIVLWITRSNLPLLGIPPAPVVAYVLSVVIITIALISVARKHVGKVWLLWVSNLADLLFTAYLVGAHASGPPHRIERAVDRRRGKIDASGGHRGLGGPIITR